MNLPALTGDSDYRDGLIGNTIAEMRQNPEKLDGVVRLTYEKYYDEFAGAIGIEESGIPLEEYTEAFKTALELSADESKPGSSSSPRTTSKPSTSNRWSTKSAISTSTTR